MFCCSTTVTCALPAPQVTFQPRSCRLLSPAGTDGNRQSRLGDGSGTKVWAGHSLSSSVLALRCCYPVLSLKSSILSPRSGFREGLNLWNCVLGDAGMDAGAVLMLQLLFPFSSMSCPCRRRFSLAHRKLWEAGAVPCSGIQAEDGGGQGRECSVVPARESR